MYFKKKQHTKDTTTQTYVKHFSLPSGSSGNNESRPVGGRKEHRRRLPLPAYVVHLCSLLDGRVSPGTWRETG